ncbi:MAG: biopolymer transporter ExbD [Planctomycetota bacterium]
MTPMIDVVLQLIIFFMFTSQFGQIARTEVDLPREPGDEEPVPNRPDFVIDLEQDGSFRLEGGPMTFNGLVRVITREAERRENPGEIRVLIRPDRSAAAGPLNALAEALAGAGIRRWSIGTRDGAAAGGP